MARALTLYYDIGTTNMRRASEKQQRSGGAALLGDSKVFIHNQWAFGAMDLLLDSGANGLHGKALRCGGAGRVTCLSSVR